ncbi:YopX family protein [Aliarcobacter lanthieri]|uniref:YopX family protein n=1 Tax=Aliarcobacter lanthieri TaxID=1355374 RepID=UPI003AA7EA46
MREIKFDLVYKTKVAIRHKKYYLNELMKGIENICDLHDCELLAKRQWTGLLDKNGDEIYEGDIVKDLEGHIMIIEWDQRFGTAQFVLKSTDNNPVPFGKYLHIHFWITTNENELEIIDNIYENSELIGVNR